MLRLREVSKSYGTVVALDRVELEVAPGEVLGLLGPNGAGKTTLVSIVAGLREPDAGHVRLWDIDVLATPHRAQREIGLAPQTLGIYTMLTVRENLNAFGRLRGLRGRRLRERVEEMGTALGLSSLLHRRASTLSGGQQRRLHSALALLHHPRLVLLDEPTVGADVETRAALLGLVRRLAADEGAIVCYTTHYLDEVEALDATIAFMRNGRIVARGSVATIVSRLGGRSMVELRFDGEAPQIDLGEDARREGSALLVPSDRPSETAASVLGKLGPEAGRLRSVEFRRPSLQTAYLALTDDGDRGDERP